MYMNERINQRCRVKKYEDRTSFLCLDMNENPEGLPEAFVKGVLEKLDGRLISGYPDENRLIEGIAARDGVRGDNLCIAPGACAILQAVFQAFTRPGSRALAVAPCFESYYMYGELYGVQIDTVSCETAFKLPFEKMREEITENTELLLLSNPDSTAGGIWTSRQLAELLDICKRTGTLAVVDESYYPFGTAGAVDMIKGNPYLIVLRSFSGLYSMAGLRAGYGAGNARLICCLSKVLPAYNVNAAGILFAEELLKEPRIVKGLIEREEDGRNYLLKMMRKAGYEFCARGGNYIFIRPRRLPEYTAACLRDRGILVKVYRDGILKDWMRVTVGSRKIMEQFWEAFLVCDG
ncbi:MAG: histidinol-phosphate aminotransferase family protein [Clostridium sp.]|nr:histidinol-phosphate aminotransferase family protein [Clostridium sp.]